MKQPALLLHPDNFIYRLYCLLRCFILLILLLPLPVHGQSNTILAEIKSPDGKLAASFSVPQTADKNGLVYSLTYGGKPVITNAGLQLQLKGMSRFMHDLQLLKTHTTTHDTT